MRSKVHYLLGATALLWGTVIHAETAHGEHKPTEKPAAATAHEASEHGASGHGVAEPKGKVNAPGSAHEDEPKGKVNAPGSAHEGEPKTHEGKPEDGPAQPALDEDAHRRERREAHVRKLIERWGKDALERPPVQAALKTHAWRHARLQRLRELALEKKDTKLLERIDALMAKETARHERLLQQLTGAVATATTTATGTAAGEPSADRKPKPEPPKSDSPKGKPAPKSNQETPR